MFWKNLGKVFANIGKGAVAAALWASQHPEVVAIVESVAHVPPAAQQAVGAGLQIGAAVAQATDEKGQ